MVLFSLFLPAHSRRTSLTHCDSFVAISRNVFTGCTHLSFHLSAVKNLGRLYCRCHWPQFSWNCGNSMPFDVMRFVAFSTIIIDRPAWCTDWIEVFILKISYWPSVSMIVTWTILSCIVCDMMIPERIFEGVVWGTALQCNLATSWWNIHSWSPHNTAVILDAMLFSMVDG